MRIAICDDDLHFCNLIKDSIYEYSNMHNWESVVDVYLNGEEIIKSKIKYDIIFMDYQMEGINGLETAKLLRTGINKLSCIIFLTSYPQIAISAYEVDTYRFVVKSNLNNGLFKALDDYRKIKRQETKIEVKTENNIVTILSADILFVESFNKIILIHLLNGNIISTRNKLYKFYQKLPEMCFAKTHKSFVVNLKYITAYNESSVKFYNNIKEIPISRNYSKQFKNKYQIYLKDFI